MDFSLSAAAAASTALSTTSAQEALAIVALKSAEKTQTAILELFSSGFSVPPSNSGRGRVLNILV
jgi:hypothetical protein